MTPAGAQALQDRIRQAGGWVVWMVSPRSPQHPGKAVAWAMVADRAGGRHEGGELVAGSLEELRAMLPAGLTRRERMTFLPRDVVETWD